MQRSQNLIEVLRNKDFENEKDRSLAEKAFERVYEFMNIAPEYVNRSLESHSFQGKEMGKTSDQLKHLEYILRHPSEWDKSWVRKKIGVDIRPTSQRVREATRKVVNSPITYAALGTASAATAMRFPEESAQAYIGGGLGGIFFATAIMKSQAVRNGIQKVYDKLSRALD